MDRIEVHLDFGVDAVAFAQRERGSPSPDTLRT